MAEIGLIASVVGVVTAGAKVSKLLYTYGKAFNNAASEINDVAREVDCLTGVLDEIGTLLQSSQGDRHGRLSSRKALQTIESIVDGRRELYKEVESAISHGPDRSAASGLSDRSSQRHSMSPSLGKKLQWSFQKKDIELWRAKVASYVSMMNLMFSTLIYADTLRKSVPRSMQDNSQSAEASLRSIPKPQARLIHDQVVQAVLSADNLERLEAEACRSRLKIMFPTEPSLEPRHYVYQAQLGSTLMRQNPSQSTLWLSELVNIGDEHSLARRCSQESLETLETSTIKSRSRSFVENNEDATANCLVEEWSTLQHISDADGYDVWEESSDGPASQEPLPFGSTTSQVDREALNPSPQSQKPTARRILVASLGYEPMDGEFAPNTIMSAENLFIYNRVARLDEVQLYWVVPKINDVKVPECSQSTSISVSVLGQQHTVEIQYYYLRNITYVFLDSPLIRKFVGDLKRPPPDYYTADHGVLFSIWNQCIAWTFHDLSPDIYHITNFSSALAPLYTLSTPIPCCLSLVGDSVPMFWKIETGDGIAKMALIFNLEYTTIVDGIFTQGEHRYFNPAHRLISYLTTHQDGRGAAVTVPALKSLDDINSLSDSSSATGKMLERFQLAHLDKGIEIGTSAVHRAARYASNASKWYRPSRRQWRRKLQKWAGLEMNPAAQILIYVVKWTSSSIIDVVVGVIDSILRTDRDVQLIIETATYSLKEPGMEKIWKLRNDFKDRVFVISGKEGWVPGHIISGFEFAILPDVYIHTQLEFLFWMCQGVLVVGARQFTSGEPQEWFFEANTTNDEVLAGRLEKTMLLALASSRQARDLVRATTLQPEFQANIWTEWCERLNLLQKSVIEGSGVIAASVYVLNGYIRILSSIDF